MTPSSRDWTTDLGLLALAGIWGVNFSVVKVVLRELDPLALNALRFPMACVAMWFLVARLPGPALPDRKDWRRILLLGFLGNVVYQLCFIIGLDWTYAGNASLLLATVPVWTVILSTAVGHERPNRWVYFGVTATFVGMILVIIGGASSLSLGGDTMRGDLLLVGAAMLWSVYTVAGKAPVQRYGSLRMTAWTLWIATPVIVLMGVPSLIDTDWSGVSAGSWAGVVYAGVLSIALAYLLWYRGVQHLGNSRTAVYSNLVPVAALITAWLWLGEVPAPLQFAGAAVILLGLSVARLAQSPGFSSLRWTSSGNS